MILQIHCRSKAVIVQFFSMNYLTELLLQVNINTLHNTLEQNTLDKTSASKSEIINIIYKEIFMNLFFGRRDIMRHNANHHRGLNRPVASQRQKKALASCSIWKKNQIILWLCFILKIFSEWKLNSGGSDMSSPNPHIIVLVLTDIMVL